MKQGIISLIPKKKKNTEYLKNWRPVSLLNVDYKIATKTIATRLEKVQPHIIHSSQSGYIKGRFIGESIRQITDIMEFTKSMQIPGIAIFLDFEKAFDSVEWDYIQKCLSSFNFGPQLRQWVGVFYKDISSCVLNNGHASKHFFLQRGVRQGYPLSVMLFVIAIELLAQSIRHSDIIKGIKVQANQEVKLTQYADDTTALLPDVQSVSNLFDLLTTFESCSGLKMLWPLSHRKDAIFNLWLKHEPVYALGVHFSYNHETAVKKKFSEKLETLKKTLNMWSQKDISLQGRINIVKALALSKLIFVCSVLETPEHFADEVNELTFDFIWNHKPAKIHETTLIKNKKEGGLGMKDFPFFDKALKLTRVKRLCSGIDAPWKYIPTYFLANVRGIELFNCNYDTKLLNLNKHIPSFYKQVICYWQEIKQCTRENKEAKPCSRKSFGTTDL